MFQNVITSFENFSVKPFEARHREAVLALWPESEMLSQPGSDTVETLIDSVDRAIAGKLHMWVAKACRRVIGWVAVIPDNDWLAHLRHLCVVPDLAERIVVARGLAETAIRQARERGYLKLVVHTDLPPGRLATKLHELGFEFSREHSKGGEHVLEFYQNLYELPELSLSQKTRKHVFDNERSFP